MKKMLTALFAIITILTFLSTTAFAAEADDSNCCIKSIKDVWDIQLIEYVPAFYVEDGFDDPLLYRIQKQQKAMEEIAIFNPGTFTKELLLNGAKVKANLDQNTYGKHYVLFDVFMEDCENSNFYDVSTQKSFYADGVGFTVIGNSRITWKIELPI